MSWGNKLVIVFIAFAGLMATLVYNAVTTKFELVTKDYYKDELRYQDKIDGSVNAVAAGNIQLDQDASSLTLRLPDALAGSVAEGEAWFYCKTDAAKDRRIPLKVENGVFVFDKSILLPDSYDLKLQLQIQGRHYYYIQHLIIS